MNNGLCFGKINGREFQKLPMNSECYGHAQLLSDIKFGLFHDWFDILLIKMTIQLLQSNFEVHVQTIKILTRISKNGLAGLAHKQLTQVGK